MGVLIPSGYAQVVHRYALTGDPEEILVTVGVQLEGDGSTTIANTLMSAWTSAMDVRTLNDYTMRGVSLYVGGGGGGTAVFESNLSPEPGAWGAGQAAPPQNLSILVKKQSAFAGRANQGRMYLPPPPEGTVSSLGVISSGTVGDIQAACDDWMGNILNTDGVVQAVILHSEGSPVTTPTPFDDFVVQALCGTQRQRMRR